MSKKEVEKVEVELRERDNKIVELLKKERAPAAQYEGFNQPLPPDWNNIVTRALSRSEWSANAVVNLLCGLRPDRTSYADWKLDHEKNPELEHFQDYPWKLDKLEKKYGQVWRKLKRAIEEGIIQVVDQPDFNNPMGAKLSQTSVLEWARANLNGIPEEFAIIPKPKNQGAADFHASVRDACYRAMLIAVLENPDRFKNKKGKIEVSKVWDEIDKFSEVFFDRKGNLKSYRSLQDNLKPYRNDYVNHPEYMSRQRKEGKQEN